MADTFLDQTRDKLREFAKERDWDKFHSPKNLAMALRNRRLLAVIADCDLNELKPDIVSGPTRSWRQSIPVA